MAKWIWVKLMLGAIVLLMGWGCVSLQGQSTSSFVPLEITFLRTVHSGLALH